MRLKSLEMHGFKSFPDRTKINFTSGVTVIVGPNGSGKSNISDAIRWVLGELSSKNIRGNKMEDVIFAGSEKRPAMGYAEVSLTIENTGEERIDSEYDEITVTRRLYRSGDSEYLINGKTSRLRDIVNMFYNTGIGKTGYSIIGQGKISEIISQKSEDRRIIFEEAAGISKYRMQKQDAERRLKDTEANMVRVNDILSELESRVGPLERESAKAKIYLELFEKKKAVEVALMLYDIAKINVDREIIERDYNIAEQELSIILEAIESLERRSEHLTELRQEKLSLYEKNSDEHSKLLEERHSLDNELGISEYQQTNIITSDAIIKENKEKSALSLTKKQSEKAELEASLESEKRALETLTSSYNETEGLLNSAREKLVGAANATEELENEKNSLVEKLNEMRVKISSEDAAMTSSAARHDEMNEEMSALKERLISLTSKKTNSEKTLSDYRIKRSELEKAAEKASEACSSTEALIAEKNKEYSSLLSETAAKEQRAEALRRMEEHFEGYSRSVKYIAESSLSGICGPVSKLIKVDRKYAVAVETALGANIQNIVVEDEDAAKAAISLLKRNNAGRATFYPLTTIRASGLNVNLAKLASMKGYIGIASDLIGYDAKYSEVIKYLLGRTVIFDDLDNASIAERNFSYSFKAVTLDGQVINSGGSYTGGASKADSGILTRSAEIADIVKDCEKQKKNAEKLSVQIKELEAQLEKQREEHEKASTDISLIGALIMAEETSLSILERSMTDEQSRLDTIAGTIGLIDSEDSTKKKLLSDLRDSAGKLSEEINSISEKINDSITAENAAEKEVDDLIAKKNSVYLECSLKTRDINDITRRTEACESDISELAEEIRLDDEKLESNKAKSAELSEKCSKLKEDIKIISEKLLEIESGNKALNDEALELEKDLNDIRQSLKEKTDRKITVSVDHGALFTKLERINSDRDKLTARLFEEYELTYAAASELDYEPVTEENRSRKNSELAKYRSKIRELGSVNVSAIEEYREVKERYDSLSTQVKDLTKSEQDLRSVITELEKEMCEKFSTTFKEVNKNFKEVFSQLFGGGSANLYLSDPDNVLTSGIEIEVAPPGKIIKNLRLLSGGEQVFVAIAIFFAILKVNPAPFCLLDEIESALDEVNVDRFASYAKMYSDNTQFIIITHRRGSMEAADTLYGITMQEKGISKVLSVDLNEMEQKSDITREITN